MNFDFTEDQQQLREAVRRWVNKAYVFERRSNIVAAGGFDRGAYCELAELGLAGLYVADSHGGMNMAAIEGMVAMEELGRGMVLEPLSQSLIASGVLGAYACDDLQAEWLPRIATGEALVVLAHQEAGARYRLDRCATRAVQQQGVWQVTGGKNLVPAGDAADAYLVPAQTEAGLAMFLVERGAACEAASGYVMQDGSRAAEARFVSSTARLVSADGLAVLEHAVDIGIATVCAEAVGVMDQTMAITAEYLNTRKQFGVAIATFQALRHRVADMQMQLELARSMSYYAHLKLDAPVAERRQAMARAKVQLGNSMRFVGQQALQLHGGIGMADEYIVSHYFKKLTQLEMSYGDTLHYLGEVSARMQESAGVFN